MITVKKLLMSGADVFPVAEQLLRDGLKVTFTVSGSSMWPLIRHNSDSVLLARPTRPARVGDIVLMHPMLPMERYILHRIYNITGDYCIALGDGCLAPDPPIPLDCVIGCVEIIYRGKRTIVCDAPGVRLLSSLWRLLLPIRYLLLRGIRRAVRLRRLLRRST